MAITAAPGGGNWSAGGSWVGGIAPTAADDVLLTVTSGAITIDGTSGTPNLCRSLDCTGYTGTLTQGSTGVLNIGDASGGKLTLVAGMTYVPNLSSTINFKSTTTGNNITTAGKSLGIIIFNGSGGGWVLQDAITVQGGSQATLTLGTLDTNGQTCSFYGFTMSAGTLTLGASSITASLVTGWTVNGGTLNANTSTITLTATTTPVFAGGGKTYNNVVMNSGSSGASITGANTFANLTITGIVSQTGFLTLSSNQTITTALTINGNSVINRVLIQSNTLGTARTITAASVTVTNADFQDITGAGAGSWNLAAITGLSGDCGGNSGITFTTPATSFWVPSGATSTGSFSAVTRWANASAGVAGTGRAPLPQDTSRFDASSIDAGSRIITQNMVRIGTVDWTGVTNTPAWTKTTNCVFFGSITLVNGMTQSGTNQYTYGGRGSNTFTRASTTWTNQLNINCIGGTLTSQDSFVSSSTFSLTSGNYIANSGGCTFTTASISGSVTRSIDMGSGTWTLSSTGTVWDANLITNLTFTKNSSTINITDTSATSKTVTGGTLTYQNITFTGDNIILASSNTFAGTFAVNNAGRTNGLKITQSTTQTLTAAANCFTTNGFAANLAKLTSTTTTAATLTAPNQAQISVDFMSIDHSTVTQSNTWYAGTNSTDGGVNTRWIFTAPPSAVGADTWLHQYPDIINTKPVRAMYYKVQDPFVINIQAFPQNVDEWEPSYPDLLSRLKNINYAIQTQYVPYIISAPVVTLDMWEPNFPDTIRRRKSIYYDTQFYLPDESIRITSYGWQFDTLDRLPRKRLLYNSDEFNTFLVVTPIVVTMDMWSGYEPDRLNRKPSFYQTNDMNVFVITPPVPPIVPIQGGHYVAYRKRLKRLVDAADQFNQSKYIKQAVQIAQIADEIDISVPLLQEVALAVQQEQILPEIDLSQLQQEISLAIQQLNSLILLNRMNAEDDDITLMMLLH